MEYPDVVYLRRIVLGLVDDQDSVHVDRTLDQQGILLTLSVAEKDMGRVVGVRGKIAQSLRVLVRAFGKPRQQHISLKIVEPV